MTAGKFLSGLTLSVAFAFSGPLAALAQDNAVAEVSLTETQIAELAAACEVDCAAAVQSMLAGLIGQPNINPAAAIAAVSAALATVVERVAVSQTVTVAAVANITQQVASALSTVQSVATQNNVAASVVQAVQAAQATMATTAATVATATTVEAVRANVTAATTATASAATAAREVASQTTSQPPAVNVEVQDVETPGVRSGSPS